MQPSSLNATLASLSIRCPQQTHTTIRLPASHKDSVLLQPTARMGGHRELLYGGRGFLSHRGHFYKFHFRCFRDLFSFNNHPRAEKGARKWVFSLIARSCLRAGGLSTRPRVTDPPALTQRDAHCVISLFLTHAHTHRLTAHREAGQGSVQRKVFKKRKQRRRQVVQSQLLSI